MLGTVAPVTSVTLNGNSVAFSYDVNLRKLTVRRLTQSVVSPFSLVWQ